MKPLQSPRIEIGILSVSSIEQPLTLATLYMRKIQNFEEIYSKTKLSPIESSSHRYMESNNNAYSTYNRHFNDSLSEKMVTENNPNTRRKWEPKLSFPLQKGGVMGSITLTSLIPTSAVNSHTEGAVTVISSVGTFSQLS